MDLPTFQMRMVVPSGPTEQAPRLQFRISNKYLWEDIPVVVSDELWNEEPRLDVYKIDKENHFSQPKLNKSP